MQPDRHIPLQGASNFRDFGGYATADGRTVKWRRLFRSDRLSELTAADYEALGAHGIRHVYDLRRESEAAASPTRWPGSAAPRLVRSPLFTDSSGASSVQRLVDGGGHPDAALARRVMIQMYERMVSEPQAVSMLGRIISDLTTAEAFPALFHCAGGKDRTGVTCALILSALGVAREDIVEDFMLTRRYFDTAANLEKAVTQVVSAATMNAWSKDALVPIFGVEPAYIETALDLVEAGGGVETFLTQKADVPIGALEAMRGRLLQ
jgi:protein-tyrosine phosphatase